MLLILVFGLHMKFTATLEKSFPKLQSDSGNGVEVTEWSIFQQSLLFLSYFEVESEGFHWCTKSTLLSLQKVTYESWCCVSIATVTSNGVEMKKHTRHSSLLLSQILRKCGDHQHMFQMQVTIGHSSKFMQRARSSVFLLTARNRHFIIW